jgi:hypothetical protein
MTDLPLFAQPRETPEPFDLKSVALEIRAKLVPLARELAEKAGPHGVSSSDLRMAAERAGYLTGQESEHFMNCINVRSVFKSAGLIATSEWRISSVARAKGSPNRVYVASSYAERRAS